MLHDTTWQGHMHTWCTQLCTCTHPDCHSHAHTCSKRVRWAVVGGKETSGHFCLSWPVGARARSGWAGCHGQPQAPVFPPSSCLCFSHSQKCSFFTVLLRSFPRVWARLWAGVSSGLAAVPASGYLLHLGWLGPPTPCIPGSKGGTLVTHLTSGAWVLLSYLWSWISYSPFALACSLPSFQVQPSCISLGPSHPFRLCEGRNYLIHLSRPAPTHL